LRRLGYIDGQNLAVDIRYADGKIDELPRLARELAARSPDVIVPYGVFSIKATREATATIPIVMFGSVDPVASGWAASLARPGGNLTGVLIAPGLALVAKKIELLKEAVPGATRIAFLSPDSAGANGQVAEAQKAAAALQLTLVVAEVGDGRYERGFAALVAQRPSALYVATSPMFVRDRRRIIDLALKHRLPAIYEWPEQVAEGGLMSYGPSNAWVAQRVAACVDLILKGARPGDIPIEQPTKIALAINLKTAKALGLIIPQSLLLRADEVIQW
jgi:putative ABC transport system substrate-binding protein